MYTTASGVAIQSHSATKMVHRNLCDVKIYKVVLGYMVKGAV
jgi:hypothetical protein